MRSSTIFGNATVSVLNTRPAVSATTMNRAKIATAAGMESATSGAELRLLACRSSSGASQTYATPVAMAIRPGTRKAPRQENAAVRAAVMPAASETPRLPQTPLNASERPRWVAVSMSIAVPTG
jgi:hypothetical protein